MLAQTPSPDPGLLGGLGGFDLAALVVLSLLCTLGLLRGVGWQVTRLVTLALAFVASGLYGAEIAGRIRGWFAPGTAASVPAHVAYFGVFLLVFVITNTLAWALGKLRRKEPVLSPGSRLGGALLGILTGAGLVLAGLACLLLFLGTDSPMRRAAQGSHALTIGRAAVEALGGAVPEPLRKAFAEQERQSKPPGK